MLFEDGLEYQESHMESPQNFVDSLMSFHMKQDQVSRGGPILYRDNNIVYSDPGDGHSIIVGDTGSTKTLRFVLPLIYSNALAGESMIILDPKGELHRKMHIFLHKKNYDIVTLNLRNPEISSDKWNPMAKTINAYKTGKSDYMLIMNDLFEDLFFKRSSADKDLYWNEQAGQLALGLAHMLLEICGPHSLNIKNIIKLRSLIHTDNFRAKYESLNRSGEAAMILSSIMDLTAENTKSCILSTFDQLIRLFNTSSSLSNMLSESSFDMRTIGTRKTAVFLIVPDEKTTLHFLATLFISQCYNTLLETAEANNCILPVRVNFILEEFCNLPKIQDFLPMLTAARSRNIRLNLVIQSYGQLLDKYSENEARAILDNCENLIYLHSRESEFLKYISELAGKNEFDRPILSPSRLQRLRKDETLIFHGRCYPFLSENVPLIFEYPTM